MGKLERVDALRQKHVALESMIDDEEKKPLPDDAVIHDLKKQKLKIKDELSGMSH
jgi:hypothetical protein